MKVHFLGCGDAFGSGGRNQSGYLVETANRLFLLDCGPTSLLAMKRAGFNPLQLDAILISHLHGDHCGGVPFFFLDGLYENSRTRPLHIAGPVGTEDKVRGLFQLMYGDLSRPKDIPPTLFHVLKPQTPQSIEEIQIFPFRVPHQTHEVSLALKVTCHDKQILFSGDSSWTDLFITHARGVDLFICECCFYDHHTSHHMSYKKIEENLPRLECKDLILTHMGQDMLSRIEGLSVKTAKDGMVMEL